MKIGDVKTLEALKKYEIKDKNEKTAIKILLTASITNSKNIVTNVITMEKITKKEFIDILSAIFTIKSTIGISD
jgi:hypothetical protein